MRKRDGPTGDSTEQADSGEEGLYGRWSRRKRMARDGEPLAPEPPRSPEPPDHAAAAHGALEGPQPASSPPLLTDADMPSLDSLHGDSDLSGFMSPGVSEELRKQALRKLFMSPVFNVRDGLNDYDEDFTRFEALGDIVTSDMRHQMELAEARRAEREAAALERDAGTGPEAVRAPVQEAEPEAPRAEHEPAQERAAARADDEVPALEAAEGQDQDQDQDQDEDEDDDRVDDAARHA